MVARILLMLSEDSMKRIALVCSFILIVSLAACGLPLRYTEVHGSGNLTTETRRVSGFNSVDLSGIGNLVIEQGDEETLEITAEDNIMDHLVSKVSGTDLSLSVEEYVNIKPTEDIIYHLTVKNISAIATSGLGNIESKSLQAEDLWVGISGSGNAQIGDLQADELDLEISGSGSMTVANLDAKTINSVISGLGNIEIAGSVDDQVIDISGSGNYEASDLFSRTAMIEISGSGSSVIWVADDLTIELSGMGSIDYYGEPVLSTEISGAGTVRSLGVK